MDGQTEGQTDRQKDRQADGWTDKIDRKTEEKRQTDWVYAVLKAYRVNNHINQMIYAVIIAQAARTAKSTTPQ